MFDEKNFAAVNRDGAIANRRAFVAPLQFLRAQIVGENRVADLIARRGTADQQIAFRRDVGPRADAAVFARRHGIRFARDAPVNNSGSQRLGQAERQQGFGRDVDVLTAG